MSIVTGLVPKETEAQLIILYIEYKMEYIINSQDYHSY